MLRVLHFIGSLRVGGAEKVVATLVTSTDRNRLRLCVLAFDGGLLERELSKEGIEVVIKPFKWFRLPFWMVATVRELRRRKVDVIHTHLFTADLLGRVVGRLAGIPVIVSTLHAPSTWKKSRSLKDRVKRYLDMVTANRINDGLIAISEEVKRYQVETGGMKESKIRVLTNPVSMSDFSKDLSCKRETRMALGLSEKDIVLINVGSLKPIKGQQYLIQAVAHLRDRHPDLKTIIVGDGYLRNDLERLCERLRVKERVLFVGLRQDIPRLLSVADIFVVSSLSEGISIAILEAMAMELPIVATDTGGNKELIRNKETGLLTIPADERDLANCIESLIRHPDSARQMAENAFEYVQSHHDSRRIADEIGTYYEELLHSKQSTG